MTGRSTLSAMPDLFDAEGPPGLSYADDFLTQVEEAELIGRIDAARLAPFRFQQWAGKRLTRSFGWSYDFASARFAPAEPIPE